MKIKIAILDSDTVYLQRLVNTFYSKYPNVQNTSLTPHQILKEHINSHNPYKLDFINDFIKVYELIKNKI